MDPQITFLRKVRQTILKHDMFRAGDRLLVGVSGGADSVALLLVLKSLGFDVTAAHLNHGWRGEASDGDQQFVEELSREIGVPCYTERGRFSEEGNLEVAGRLARRRFFGDLMRRHQLSKVALAHNREDRVETFMLHLVRGAGINGLVSMAPVSGTVVRPLIETSRREIEEFLKSAGRLWRTDATNADVTFSRNRMRHEGIPHLAALFNERLVDALSRTVLLLQDEDQWMTETARTWLASHQDNLGVTVGALRDTPPALTRRVIREAIRHAGSDLVDLTFDHIEAVRALLEPGKSGKVLPLPGGIRVVREFDRVSFRQGEELDLEFSYTLPVPGDIHVAEAQMVFRSRLVSSDEMAHVSENDGSGRVFADGERVGPYVTIRNWKPGDYYRPDGLPAGKLKKLFQKARVPRSQRRRWPVVARDSAIVWVASFPVSREFLPDGRSKKIVAFEALPD